MKNLTFVNQSKMRMPKAFVQKWIAAMEQALPSRDRRKVLAGSMTVVFLDAAAAKRLNKKFRGRDYATDVLSFPGMESGWLGELVICPQVIERQAREHELSFKTELGYMVLHGLLHLLGYDHETSRREELRMMRLQDKIFAVLRDKF